MLDHGLRFEYLWRYAYRVRPQLPPLRGSFWNSCGGSITSVSNPTIHPMSVMACGDAKYLIDHLGGQGDPQTQIHRMRLEDTLNWSAQTIALHPEVAGFGTLGVINERYSVTDGFFADWFADGSRSAIGFIYHAWAAGCILEGQLQAQGRLEG
jgi:hypothetical protein